MNAGTVSESQGCASSHQQHGFVKIKIHTYFVLGFFFDDDLGLERDSINYDRLLVLLSGNRKLSFHGDSCIIDNWFLIILTSIVIVVGDKGNTNQLVFSAPKVLPSVYNRKDTAFLFNFVILSLLLLILCYQSE